MQSNLVIEYIHKYSYGTVETRKPHKWFQLYWQGCREKSLTRSNQAEQSGYRAIVITVDAPHVGIRGSGT